MKGLKKTIFTLNINNYCPEITAITYPLLRYWAAKIGADFHIIKDRKFPNWPVTYEKLQIYQLGREMGNDWNIYVDSDAIIHPETLDWTQYMKKDTVAHNGRDFANIRWRYNDYMRRDGRDWGSCNWFTIASDWCLDIWRPLDVPFEEAVENIFPTADERNGTTTRDHLIDDYTLSNNIARFGIKAITIQQLQKDLQFENSAFHYHLYNISEKEKIDRLTELVDVTWKIPRYVREYGK